MTITAVLIGGTCSGNTYELDQPVSQILIPTLDGQVVYQRQPTVEPNPATIFYKAVSYEHD